MEMDEQSICQLMQMESLHAILILGLQSIMEIMLPKSLG